MLGSKDYSDAWEQGLLRCLGARTTPMLGSKDYSIEMKIVD